MTGLLVKGRGKILKLALPPAPRIEGFIDKARNVVLQLREDWFPRADGQVKQRTSI